MISHTIIDGRRVYLADGQNLSFGSSKDIGINWDGTRLNGTQLTADSEIRWGVDGAGIGQRWYGDTAGSYMLWDQSANQLVLTNATFSGFVAVLPAGDNPGFTFQVTTNNASNALGAAGYFQTTTTGTQAGTFVYGTGSWVNIPSGTVGANKWVCVQDNGIWEDAAATITNARLVFGLRMEKVVGDNDALTFPFSINTSPSGITALFDCNGANDFGVFTNAGADNNELIPFLREMGGGMRYIKLYTAV